MDKTLDIIRSSVVIYIRLNVIVNIYFKVKPISELHADNH